MSKKEANKLRYRKLNAQIANATKASKKGDKKAVSKALKTAYKLASTPTVWETEQLRVKKNAVAHGVDIA